MTCTVSKRYKGGTKMTDEDYLIALLNKDEDALDELMEKYSNLLWVIASKYLNYSNLGGPEDIEELVSDVFIRIWNDPKKFDPSKGSIKTYLGMLTRSMAINKVKSIATTHHEELTLETMSELTREESSMDWNSFFDEVMKLEPVTRNIIIRRYFYDMKPKQIQEETGYDSKLIDNKLYHGKKQLIQNFKQAGGY